MNIYETDWRKKFIRDDSAEVPVFLSKKLFDVDVSEGDSSSEKITCSPEKTLGASPKRRFDPMYDSPSLESGSDPVEQRRPIYFPYHPELRKLRKIVVKDYDPFRFYKNFQRLPMCFSVTFGETPFDRTFEYSSNCRVYRL